MDVPAWVWVTTQLILFGILLFANLGSNFEVTNQMAAVAKVLETTAFVILGISVYNLRHSLNIAPQPVKNGKLQSNGIYKYIRHPMYTAVFLVFTGSALNSGSYWKFVVLVVLIIFFRVKTEYEEGLLKAKYSDYKKYMKNTGSYFPVFIRKK